MTLRSLVWTCVAAVGLLLPLQQYSYAAELRIATGDYPPFTDAAENGGGSVNQFISKVAKRAGLAAEFEFNPWMRSLELTRTGRYEATSFWYFSEERDKDFIHVGPVMQDRLVFFRHADTPMPVWNELSDLSGMTIGAVTGYTYTPEFWELSKNGTLNVEVAPSDEANFKKLRAGRIDLFPMSEESGLRLVSKIFSDAKEKQIVYSPQTLVETNGYLLVSRSINNASELAERLQTAVDEIAASVD